LFVFLLLVESECQQLDFSLEGLDLFSVALLGKLPLQTVFVLLLETVNTRWSIALKSEKSRNQSG
jgi:hypothetical protein